MTVVVGIKGKQPTALRFAAQAAADRNTNLRIVHCLDRRTAADFVSVPYDTFPPDSWRATGEAVMEHAREFLQDMSPQLDIEFEMADGLPFQTLREETESGAALLVVGTDAQILFSPLYGGSVTERLISHARIPVAVVPERNQPNPISGPIFVAIDAKSPATGPLRFAFVEASRTTKELHVAHVIPEGDMLYHSVGHKVDVSEVLAGWSEEFPEVTVRRRFFFDDADDGCVRVSEEASLLVLGRRKTHIFGHPVLGEIANRVHCPCVVVPDEPEGNVR